jgi:hypothetical protein
MKGSFSYKLLAVFSSIGVVFFLQAACVNQIGTHIGEDQTNMTTLISSDRTNPAKGPLTVDPENPRYFTDNHGGAVLLTGSHTWANFLDVDMKKPVDRFDYDEYLEMMVEHNHNFFRLWTWEENMDVVTGGGNYWSEPPLYARTGPGLALDGEPKYDLDSFNQAYFDRLRSRIIAAGEKGIYASIMLFNGWSVENKDGAQDPWPGHPYHRDNNINGIDGDPNYDGKGVEIHTLQVPRVTELQKAYVRQVIDTVNDLDNVLFEISNESSSQSYEWQYEMIRYIKEYEKKLPQQHPVGMTVPYPNGSNEAVLRSPADWVSLNGEIDNPPAADGSKVIIYDMDHLCGVCMETQWVWKSFTQGLNPIFMDPDDWFAVPPNFDLKDARLEKIRRDMGYVLSYAERMNLEAMTPHGELSSTGYALANLTKDQAELFVYLPKGGKITVDLRNISGNLTVEWFNPATGKRTIPSTPSTGGAKRTLMPPFRGEAVLYLYLK